MDPDIRHVLDLVSQLRGSNLPLSDRQSAIVAEEMTRAANPLLGAALALYRIACPEPSPDSGNLVWWNGELRPSETAQVSIASPTVQYGRGIFEGIFCLRHEDQLLGFRFADHYERFLRGAKTIGLDCPYTVNELCEATIHVLQANDMLEMLKDPQYQIGYIRPTLHRATDKLSGIEISSGPVVVSISVIPWRAYVKDAAFKVKTFDSPIPFNEDFAAIKASGKYLVSHYAKLLLSAFNTHSETKFNEALLVDPNSKQYIELSAENICVLTDHGALLTPAHRALKGITLDTVCQIAPQLGYEVVPCDMTTASLRAEAPHGNVIGIFACGSAAGLKQLIQIDDWQIDSEYGRAEFGKFAGAYKEIIRGQRPEFAAWVTRI